MAQKYPTLSGSEVAEYLRNAFAPRSVVVRLVDHGEDVEIKFLPGVGSTTPKLDPVPLDRLSTIAELDVLIAHIKHHLDEPC